MAPGNSGAAEEKKFSTDPHIQLSDERKQVILDDKTVRGGTGWGAKFAKICNKPLYVFDQSRLGWYEWTDTDWAAMNNPIIQHSRFTGTGTRNLDESGKSPSTGYSLEPLDRNTERGQRERGG